MDRRNFIKKGSGHMGVGLLMASNGLSLLSLKDNKPVKLGFVGVGGRGFGMLKVALSTGMAEVTAICDIIPERVERAQRMVVEAGQEKPEGFSRGPEDYKRMADKHDLDAIYTATPMSLHAPVMIAAMKGKKYAATEMPACLNVEQGWELVETSNSTGMPCMLMENYCYMRNVQMILNMVDQQMFGEITHCEVGYQHDTRYVNVDPKGELLWRGQDKLKHNGNRYPTHAMGPAAQWNNINRGNRFEYVVSMSSQAAGMKSYIADIAGEDHPNSKLNFMTGDVNTSLIKTSSGATITLYYDSQNPRPVDFIWRIQGTKGIHSGTLNKIHFDESSPPHQWEEVDKYAEKFDHPNWKKYGDLAQSQGHGGSDYLCMLAFLKSVQSREPVPIDVYDAATWSVITELTEKSVRNKSQAVDFPDFTRGQWRKRKSNLIEAF